MYKAPFSRGNSGKMCRCPRPPPLPAALQLRPQNHIPETASHRSGKYSPLFSAPAAPALWLFSLPYFPPPSVHTHAQRACTGPLTCHYTSRRTFSQQADISSQAPRRCRGGRVSPGRAYCRQAAQEALNTLPPASPAPPPVNGVLPVARCIFWVLNAIPLRSKLAAKALLLFPAQPRVPFR